QMKDELLAVVGHELRTPLTSIRGSLGLLAAGAVGPLSVDSERLVSIAGDNTERLVRIVDDLLEMGKLDQRRMRMNLRPTCVMRICREVADTLAETAQHRDVQISCTVAEEKLCAVLDPDRMQRVISNLLDNAVRMSPAGGRVNVHITRLHEGDTCRIEVVDDGPGVPESDRGRIFDRFVQVNSGDTRPSGGLGLGLAICAEIVELHNGVLTVDAAPGRGARFRCDLPLKGPGAPVPAAEVVVL
ncbi:MAG: HAMP domain-containing histidine kinase, partial [Thermoleophilia bacterium]|nr:HAMP domain-containing histidine kinase [Thermoleophilia bacterium]